VRQEDLFFSQLTVRETLSLAAELQLPDTWAPERKKRYITDLLFRLGLVRAAVFVMFQEIEASSFANSINAWIVE
jgi:ABC-type multidrug transport system ATPase subunit